MSAYFMIRTTVSRYTVCVEAEDADHAAELAASRWGEPVVLEDRVELGMVLS